jgi:hypothetical protein
MVQQTRFQQWTWYGSSRVKNVAGRESGEGPRETETGTKMENAGFYTNVQYMSRMLFADFSGLARNAEVRE